MQRHTGEDGLILRQRKATYETAKQAKPDRWKNRKTRCWDHYPNHCSCWGVVEIWDFHADA